MRGEARRRRGRAARRRVALALLVLFALRSLVPAGYMPAPAAMADGLIRMTLCDGYTTRTVLVDAEGRIVEEPENTTADICDFALASLASTLPLPDLLPLPSLQPRQAAAPGHQALWLHPPVRGPPLGSRAPPAISA